MKLRITRRLYGGWSLISGGVMIGWQPTFRRACRAAAEWIDEGLYLNWPDPR